MRTCMNLDTPSIAGVVGAAGFEPTTFCAQGRRATRLRYAPPLRSLGAGFLPAPGTARKRNFRVVSSALLDQTPEQGRPGRSPSINVLGGALQPCSLDPVTGFYRDGCCNTGREDLGLHTVCVIMTAEFLAFSKG